MNLRTKYKRLKQFVARTKADYREVNIDRTQLEHYRYKSNLPLFYERDDLATDELAFREAKDRLKNEFSKLIDQHTEILPDGTITLDVWFNPKDSLVTDGVVIVGNEEKTEKKSCNTCKHYTPDNPYCECCFDFDKYERKDK